MKIGNLIFLFISYVISVACTTTQGENKNTSKQAKPQKETTAILAVTGFGVEQTNITMQELKNKFCAGEVYVLEHLKNDMEKIWGCPAKKTLKNAQDFASLAKNNLLLTDLENLTPQFKALQIDGIDFFENNEKYNFYLLGDAKKTFDFKQTITKFTLTGTTAVTRYMGQATDKNGMEWLIEHLLPKVKDSDYLHVSNEVSATDNCKYISGMKFCMKTEHLDIFRKLGVDIVELTGNHNLDYGKEAYISTMQWYKNNQMKVFGGGLNPEEAYEPMLLTIKEKYKIAFVGFNESCPVRECAGKGGNQVGAAFYDSLKVTQIIKKLKEDKSIAYVIASVQFNESDSYSPTKSQQRISKYLIDIGADFVYGSQAHQVQQIAFYKGKPIFYGLGNFLFDQIHRIGVRQGFFLHNYFYKGKIIQSVPVYTFTSTERRPALANEEEIKAIKKVIFLDKNLYK